MVILLQTVSITINFKEPVCDLRLKIDDLDQTSCGSSGPSPRETMLITPVFSGIAPSVSPPTTLFNFLGSTIVPAGNNNTGGWVEFNGLTLSAVTIRYNRVSGCLAFLDSLTYNCCEDCMCDNQNNSLTGNTTIPNSGSTTASVDIHSAGVPIKKLNISLPYYKSFADPECIKCDAPNISQYGKITNLPTIAGVTPSFVGPTSSGSAEIVYEFSTPTVINHTINLALQFPPTLNLTCCPNRVNYCVKLGLIDKDCKICEQLLCVKSQVTGGGSSGGGSSTPVHQGSSKSRLDQNQQNPKLLLTPNPTSSKLDVQLPSDAEGTIEILDLNGKRIKMDNVSTDAITLDVSKLTPGTYLLKYTSGDAVMTEKFVKQ